MKIKNTLPLTALLGFTLAAGSAHGALLVYEGFDYTDIDAYYEFNFDTTEIEESVMGSILLEKLIPRKLKHHQLFVLFFQLSFGLRQTGFGLPNRHQAERLLIVVALPS